MDKWALQRAFAPGAPADEAFADALGALLTSAVSACPGLSISPEAFMRSLGARASDGALETLHTADLYLAFGCLSGDPAALRLFDERVISKLGPALTGIDSSAAFVDEVCQRVRERLLVSREGVSSKLSEYSGRGSLQGWARTVAVRLALNVKRESPHDSQLQTDEVLADSPFTGDDLELDFVRSQHRGDFGAAFKETLAQLDSRERNVLRLSYVDRLTIDQIGAVYGTHRATAARWLVTAREHVVAGTRQRLAQRLKLTSSELESLLTALQSNLEISLARLLGPTASTDAL